jgi:HK97 family phage major capsid protein
MSEIFQILQDIGKNVDAYSLSQAKIQKQIEEMQENINIVRDSGGGGGYRPKSLGQLAVEGLREQGLNSDLPKGSRKTVTVKAAGTMTTGNVTPVGTNAIPFSLSDAEAGLTRVVRRRPWIMELANVSSTNKMYVQWSEQENPDGTAAATAEGTDKAMIDFDWVEKSKKVEKITAFIKVSKESLDDLDGLGNDINIELRETVMLKVDEDLLSGDGTTPTLDGILNQATPYSAGSFAGTIVAPNFFDALRTAIAQVAAENFNPTAIVLNPADVATMDLSKSATDGHYVLPPFKSANGMVISGVQLVENNGIAPGDFLVGDFSKLNVKLREGFTIDVGYEGDDFVKNLVTILGEIRLAAYIKAVHQKAFVYGDFASAITALTV